MRVISVVILFDFTDDRRDLLIWSEESIQLDDDKQRQILWVYTSVKLFFEIYFVI